MTDANGTKQSEQVKARVEEFATKISAAWNTQVESILEVGRLLIQAKAELPHGAFMKMTQKRLPFSHNTANRLMQIARHPILSNSAHVQKLPRSWGTLHALCGLPHETLERYLADGTINAETERPQVEAMLAEIHGDRDDDPNDDDPGDRKRRKRGKKDRSEDDKRDYQIARACKDMIFCMVKWPDVDTLPPRYFTGNNPIYKRHLKKLVDWVAALADAAPDPKIAEIAVEGTKKKRVTPAQRAALEAGRAALEARGS